MEKFKWNGNTNGTCWKCGEKFPTETLEERANGHERKWPGFRRAHTSCQHGCNHGDIAIFPRDADW